MLELKDASRLSGREPVLKEASFRIDRNVPTSVLGLSPPERVAFLRLLSGADKPQSGTVKLDGKDVAEARRKRGWILQVGPTGAKPSGQRLGRVIGQPAAERVGLGGRMDARISDLDPCQRWRLVIALAREQKPTLILLDAPGAELDPGSRDRFVADLGIMLAESGAVVVLAAGSADEAAGLGGDVLVLNRGRLVQSGAAAEVFSDPASLAVAAATSYPQLNMLPMAAQSGIGVLADGSTFQPAEGVVLPEEGACTLAFRPEDVLFARQGAACVRFVARVAGEEIIKGRRFVQLGFAGSKWLSPQPASPPPRGVMLNAFVDSARLMIFGADGRRITRVAPIAFSIGASSSLATDSPGG